MHIRQTDNSNSKTRSLLSLFINKIEEIITNYAGAHFYVSSNKPQVESYIQNRFSERIYVFENKQYSGNYKNEMKKAILKCFYFPIPRKIIEVTGHNSIILLRRLGTSL